MKTIFLGLKAFKNTGVACCYFGQAPKVLYRKIKYDKGQNGLDFSQFERTEISLTYYSQ